MKNIILTGFMGTGKTEVSKIIAAKTKRQRLCIDDMIEFKAGKHIADIFKENGEKHFRNLEAEVVKTVSKDKNVVVDAGGGAIIDQVNLKNFKRHGIVFCLFASVDAIYERTKHHKHRPLLNVENPKEKIAQLLNERKEFYAKADHAIDTTALSPDEAADKIIEIMS